MTTATKLAAFTAGLALLFGGAALAGGAIDPDRSEDGVEVAGHGANEPASNGTGGHAAGDSAGDDHAPEVDAGHGGGGVAHPVRGVAVAENGLRLAVIDSELRRGRTEAVRFRIVDDAGETVRDFDVEHTKRMHVIVARRDLNDFQHLHPRQRRDGSWTFALRLDQAGSYRVFADFSHEGEAVTLATDLRVDGAADLRPLPAPAPTAVSDGGYDVALDSGSARPGKEADLRFTITKDGHAVHTEPYLGAGGHLVALREGDLAFLHVHPTEHGHGEEKPAEDEHDDSVGFAATFPTAGKYRLFLQFKHEGSVRTAECTHEVAR